MIKWKKQTEERTNNKMEEYLIPAINGQKKRNLTYKEIEWLIKTITDAEHKSPDETRLKEAIEKTKEMFTVTSVMVLVKAGTFQMGDEHGDLRSFCRPVHKVYLAYDYYIGKYEVTFNEYDAYCEVTGKEKLSDYGSWAGYNYNMGRGNKPLINLSWWEAIAYCNWLSE